MKTGWNCGLFALLLSLAVLCLPVSSGSAARYAQRTATPARAAEPIDVGMVALVANPQRYDGKRVRVVGFLYIRYESGIFIHKEDCRYGLTFNALELRLSPSQRQRYKNLSFHYVLIEGVVHPSKSPGAEWGGEMGDITRLEPWPWDQSSRPPL
jgi:hypothetical protein